jgi:hypothetical protein
MYDGNPSSQNSNPRKSTSKIVKRLLAGLAIAGVLLVVSLAFIFQRNYGRFNTDGIRQSSARHDLLKLVEAQYQLKKKYGFFSSDLSAYSEVDRPTLPTYNLGFIQATALSNPSLAPLLDPSRHILSAKPSLAVGKDMAIDQSILLSRMREICPDCMATNSGFKAFAVANLDEDADWDIWTIDQDSNLLHVVDDLK